MVKLVERGDAIDLVTLKEELGRSGDLDEVGGPAYIAALVDGVPRSTNVEHYAKIIKEKATLRSLIFSANKIVATAYEARKTPTSSSIKPSMPSSPLRTTRSATVSSR
jgi:replicative DNA helicase